MKQKQTYFVKASFAILVFVMLGYVVKFYPEVLTGFDSSIQSTIRGQLPQLATHFFSAITFIGNASTQIALVIITFALLLNQKWYAESGFVAISGILAAIVIAGFKNIYQRPRPSLEHLVHAGGFSFPSGHSLGTMLIIGSLIVILSQRIKQQQLKLVLQIILELTILLVGLSRIYLGVHYPTDVIAGFTLGYGLLNLLYPIYDQKRFEWRFQNKQK
ncbi:MULTISPECIES: phosphatase PAP2 family protein [Streptococcus]|uniref:Phosphatase PAP2 family protein n=1 Tax=Streptococcus caledonicus TaxID=2614158 RepID=A0ABW0UBP9_9STRE|nr:phosphatase PAP2 family protein [Streptococcus sp. S784/96/1]